MSTNSKNILLFLVILQTILSSGLSTASTTLLITGHSSNNIYKYAFARKFASQVELDRAHGADIILIGEDPAEQIFESEDGVLLRSIGGVPLVGNLTRIVVSRLGSEEMSLDHIQVLWQFLDSDQPLIVVEIGEQSVQTRALLAKGAVCWGQSRAPILSPNLAYLCNDVSPEMVQKIVEVESIRTLDAETRSLPEPYVRPFWPSLFASAAKTERKNRKRQAQEVIEVEDDVEEIVDQIMENIEKKEAKTPAKIEKAVAKKLNCKYRKSCYESGEKPSISADFSIGSFDWDSLTNWFTIEEKKDKTEEEDDNEDGDENNEEEDLTPKKLKCKYRLDCYKKKGIQLTGKDGEREERKSLLAGKAAPQQGKKRTLKEIAEKTMKNVKVAAEKAASRPLPTSVIAERKLNEIEEKLTEKLQCKYRKSCYETGELPVIEQSWSMPIHFSTHPAEEAVEEVDFQEMEDLEKKVFCKYRKSCYESGIKPDIEPDIQIHSFSDLGELPEIIETRKLTLQEKCKYRKSCYETGILPEIHPQLETVVQKEVSSVIPSNVEELKKFCKYRKSCYEELAQSSASVETIKNIRKRRMVEKEVRRRKVRRARMRRRLSDIEFESIGKTRPKSRKYATQPNETQPEKKELPPPPVKSPTKKRKEESKEEPPEPIVEQPVKVKKIKTQKVEPTPEEIIQEEPKEQETPKQKKKAKKPEVEPIPEPEAKLKKAKKTEAEPEPEVKPKKIKKTESELKKSEPEPKKVEKPEPIPEPIPEPKVKKSQKKSGKKEEEEKPTPKRSEISMEAYKEEKRLQTHCKYRKSCYETKVRPVIDQTFATLMTKFDSHVNEHYESLENKELSEADRKLACKYRKTCYETNQRPIIDSSFSIWGPPAIVRPSDDDDDEEEEGEEINLGKIHKEADRKLACKYRKSCYETNKRPVIHQSFSSIWGGSKISQKETNAEEKDNWHSMDTKKLGCKYRKSCYQRKGFDFDGDEEEKELKKEEIKKPEVKKEQPKKEIPVPVKKEKKLEKELPREIKKPEAIVPKKEESHEENEDDHEETKRETEDLPELGRGQKLHCKYRKSCYSNSPRNETPSRTVIRVVDGLPQRVKCNEYYLSCREQMGLPPKEKAPIGPNGRKLCRKKKAN